MNANLKNYINELRTTDREQHRGDYFENASGEIDEDEACCALGLALVCLGASKCDPDSLPHIFEHKLGISGGIVSSIIMLNDDEYMSFPEIADWLESKYGE